MMKYPIKLFGDLIQQDDINHACLSIFLETTNPKTHEQTKNQILKNQEIVERIKTCELDCWECYYLVKDVQYELKAIKNDL